MKCPINEIQDDLTRNMAWELYKNMPAYDLLALYNENMCVGRLAIAIRAARLKNITNQ